MKVGIEQMQGFVGVWEGFGHAEYPTITPIDYREELVISSNRKDPVLHYLQRTWKVTPGGAAGEQVFWESGFLIDKTDGIFEIVSAQKSGRIELLRGAATMENGMVITLNLKSVSIVNDGRMIASSRLFTFAPDSITYRLEMSTHFHPEPHVHLSSRLTRSGGP